MFILDLTDKESGIQWPKTTNLYKPDCKSAKARVKKRSFSEAKLFHDNIVKHLFRGNLHYQ